MKKLITVTLLLPLLTFASPGLTQIVVDFRSQPAKEDLIKVVQSATKDKNYSIALRVANNTVKLFPDYATAYLTRAIAFDKLGNQEAARLDFEQAKKLYLRQLKSSKINLQERNEARSGLEIVERYLKLAELHL